jgi:hypothetical protein
MTYKKRKNTGIDHPGVFSFIKAFPWGKVAKPEVLTDEG